MVILCDIDTNLKKKKCIKNLIILFYCQYIINEKIE